MPQNCKKKHKNRNFGALKTITKIWDIPYRNEHIFPRRFMCHT